MTSPIVLRGQAGDRFEPAKLWFVLTRVSSLVLLWWLLFGTGFRTVDRLFGAHWCLGDWGRRVLLFGCAAFYLLRLTLTGLYLLSRRMGWLEALGTSAMLYGVDFVLVMLGGTVQTPLMSSDIAGIVLFLTGSLLTSGAELQREQWRRSPVNRGRLYTGGLYQWSRHINYFGEVVSFSGYALIAHTWVAALVPFGMLLGFIGYNIPSLDQYLSTRYGSVYTEYAARTKRLIPFIY